MTPHRRNLPDRRGVAATEAALLLPIFVITLLGLVSVGWHLNEMQLLHNGVRQGARAATSRNNSNKEVRDAVIAALADKIDTDNVRVFISKVHSNGDVDYEVQSLDANEEGQLVKVTVKYDGGLTAQLVGDSTRSTSVVVRRPR